MAKNFFAIPKFNKGEESQFTAKRRAASTHFVLWIKRAQILTRITSLPSKKKGEV